MLNRTHGLKLLNKSLKPLNIASRRFRHIRCCQGRAAVILHLLSSLTHLASPRLQCQQDVGAQVLLAHTFGTNWATRRNLIIATRI